MKNNIPVFNSKDVATDLKYTSTGPVAKINGTWYSVNGNSTEIVDVRYRLSDHDLLAYNLK